MRKRRMELPESVLDEIDNALAPSWHEKGDHPDEDDQHAPDESDAIEALEILADEGRARLRAWFG